MRIEPHPLPKIGIFMNKTKTYANKPTKEAQFYMHEVKRVCEHAAETQKIQTRFFSSFVRLRVGIQRAVTRGGVPNDLAQDFKNLWLECEEFINV